MADESPGSVDGRETLPGGTFWSEGESSVLLPTVMAMPVEEPACQKEPGVDDSEDLLACGASDDAVFWSDEAVDDVADDEPGEPAWGDVDDFPGADVDADCDVPVVDDEKFIPEGLLGDDWLRNASSERINSSCDCNIASGACRLVNER